MFWDDNLPIFQGEEFDDPLLHLIKFNIHVWKVKIEWHEECLMKMFMLTLEGNTRDWYEWLEPKSLFSLKDMHQVFYENYKGNSPSLSWDCCEQSQNIIQYLLDIDENLVDMHLEDLLEAIQEFHMHPSYHKNLDRSVEEEISQEIKDICQDIPENPNIDLSSLVTKAQEDI